MRIFSRKCPKSANAAKITEPTGEVAMRKFSRKRTQTAISAKVIGANMRD